MASSPAELMRTERFDEEWAKWFLKTAVPEDLLDAQGQPLIGPHSTFCISQGLTGNAWSLQATLTLCRASVRKLVESNGKVFYRYSPHQAAVKGGRLYGSCGLQMMPKALRVSMAKAFYHDVDAVNCQPVIAVWLADQLSVPCPLLKAYVDDREAVFQAGVAATGLTKDVIKTTIIAVLCGGSPAGSDWSWLSDLQEEVQVLHAKAWACPDYDKFKPGVYAVQAAKNKLPHKKASTAAHFNLHGSLFAIVMQTVEAACLNAAVEALSLSHRHVSSLIFDGMLVEKNTGEDTLPDELLQSISEHVRQKVGVMLAWVVKPWGPGIPIPSQPRPLKPKPVPLAGKGDTAARRAAIAKSAPAPKKPARKPSTSSDSSSSEEEDGGAMEEEENDDNLICPGVTKVAYANMKAEFELTHFYEINTNSFVEVSPSEGIQRYPLVHAKEYFDAKWAFTPNPHNFRYRVSMLDIWRQDPERKMIKRISLEPTDEPDVFYMPVMLAWRKHAKLHGLPDFEVVMPADAGAGAGAGAAVDGAGAGAGAGPSDVIPLFNELLDMAAGGQKEVYDYLLRYFAHMLQHTLDQPGVAIVLTGQKGIGMLRQASCYSLVV